MLDPRRLLRWIYMGRVSIAVAIFLAAVRVWLADDMDTGAIVVASLVLAITTAFTVGSLAYSDIWRRPLHANFLYLQSIFDLLLVTAVVHVTGVERSQFAALYILVIAASTLLLPLGGGLLIAALGNVLYVAYALWAAQEALDFSVWLQLGVFAAVALALAYLAVQLRREGEGKHQLLAELGHLKLQADDILNNIRSGVLTVDSAGRLLFANPMAGQLLGLRLDQQIGSPILEPIEEVAPELAGALRRSLVDTVRTARAEGTVRAAGRTEYPVGVTTTYTEGDGRRTDRTATAIFSDISDQKRLEALRLRAERLEGVAELSAALAHEIKNPLASIRSAIEQLGRVPHVSDDERTLAELVMRESDRLSRLLTEFLDFSRVRVTSTRRVDIGTIVRGAAALVAEHPDRGDDVRITCSIPEGESLYVEGDEDLLHRAIFNLALNAVQASPPRGEVRLEIDIDTEHLQLATDSPAGNVRVRVSDEGPGIPRDVRGRLFDPFFTTKPGGSGLGLAVVHRAIEAHRGLVFYDAGSGEGCRFTIVLPRALVTESMPVAVTS